MSLYLYFISPSHLHCPEEGKLSRQLALKHLFSVPQHMNIRAGGLKEGLGKRGKRGRKSVYV